MNYTEAKSEYEKAMKARRAWPITEAEYAAADERVKEMRAIMQAMPEFVPISAPSQAQLDETMRKAGFEAAGNGGELWNRLNPVHGENF